jgi:uncharacterized protein YukJ
MAIPNYSVLKGTPVGPGSVSGSDPHYRFLLSAGDGNPAIGVDVNVQSTDGSEILYLINSNYTPADAAALDALAPGLNGLTADLQSLRLDYVRGGPDGSPLVNRSQMQLLALSDSDSKGDSLGPLNDAVADLLNKALADPNGRIYAFGSAYADPGGDTGIHDIHMNQGNPPGRFETDNGTFQDGAIFIELPAQQTWSALFIAFQTESWETDDQGNPQ